MMEEMFFQDLALPAPAKPSAPKPSIGLETLPETGIISSYGAFASEQALGDYAENFLRKLKRQQESQQPSPSE